MRKTWQLAVAAGALLACGTRVSADDKAASKGSWSWSASCRFTESVTRNQLKIKNTSAHGLARGSVVQVEYKYNDGRSGKEDITLRSGLAAGSEQSVNVPVAAAEHTSCAAKVTGGTPLESHP